MMNVITSLNTKNSVCLCYTHSYLKLYPDLWKSFWVCDAKDLLLFYLLVKYISYRCFLKPQINNECPVLTWSKYFLIYFNVNICVCVHTCVWTCICECNECLYVRMCVFYYFTVQRESRTLTHTHTHSAGHVHGDTQPANTHVLVSQKERKMKKKWGVSFFIVASSWARPVLWLEERGGWNVHMDLI